MNAGRLDSRPCPDCAVHAETFDVDGRIVVFCPRHGPRFVNPYTLTEWTSCEPVPTIDGHEAQRCEECGDDYGHVHSVHECYPDRAFIRRLRAWAAIGLLARTEIMVASGWTGIDLGVLELMIVVVLGEPGTPSRNVVAAARHELAERAKDGTCPACGGSGRTPGTTGRQTCEACNGTGTAIA